MPFSPLHTRKLSKNIALALVLVLMVGIFFGLTIVKVGS